MAYDLQIHHPYDLAEIEVKFRNHLSSQKRMRTNPKEKIREYFALFAHLIRKGIRMANDRLISRNEIQIDWDRARQALGKYNLNGNQNNYWLPWFHKHYPLVKITRKGTQGILTVIEPLYDLTIQELEIAAASKTPFECFQTLYARHQDTLVAWIDGQEDLVDFVALDRRSLENYILANDNEQRQSRRESHKTTLQRNLVFAIDLYQCAECWEANGGLFGIPQIVVDSAYGRRYYQGLNLQNAPKIVRHAALGRSHQYDISVSVFSWLLNKVKQIDPLFKAPATLEYIDHKTAIRRRLARDLNIQTSFQYKLDLVKEIMTAVGFGAKTEDTPHTAINSIILNKEARARFLKDPFIKEFIKEQKAMRDLVIKHFEPELKQLPLLYVKGKFQRNKAIAYLYQQEERQIIDLLTAQSRSQGDFLLVIHDGFYTKRPQPIQELRLLLRQHNQYAELEHEEHTAYTWFDDRAHREFIRQEEQRANPQGMPSNYRHILIDTKKIYSNSNFYDSHKDQAEYDPELDAHYD